MNDCTSGLWSKWVSYCCLMLKKNALAKNKWLFDGTMKVLFCTRPKPRWLWFSFFYVNWNNSPLCTNWKTINTRLQDTYLKPIQHKNNMIQDVKIHRPAQTWPWKFPLQTNIVRHDVKTNFAFTWIHVCEGRLTS